MKLDHMKLNCIKNPIKNSALLPLLVAMLLLSCLNFTTPVKANPTTQPTTNPAPIIQVTPQIDTGPHTGMAYWTPSQWAGFWVSVGLFISATVTPFILMIFSNLKTLKTTALAAATSQQSQLTSLHSDIRELGTNQLLLAQAQTPPGTQQIPPQTPQTPQTHQAPSPKPPGQGHETRPGGSILHP